MSFERDALGQRKAHRQVHYARQMGVKLDAETKTRVEGLADQYGLSLAEVLRCGIDSGWPRVKAVRHKAKENTL